MNTQRRILLVIALIAACGIALLVYAMSGRKTAQVSLPQSGATEQVLVAKADIPAGKPLTPDMVLWTSWPTGKAPLGAVTGGNAQPIHAHIDHTVARTRIIKGMPILDAMLIKTNGHGYMAAVLKPGMRAISLPMSVDRAVAGFIRPYNYVDMLLTRSVNGKPVTHDLLNNVLLLAIDQTAEEKPDAPDAVGAVHTVTVEVTPEQAELLTKAHTTGTISLTLRPLAQNATGDRFDKTGPITIIRGGPAPDADK